MFLAQESTGYCHVASMMTPTLIGACLLGFVACVHAEWLSPLREAQEEALRRELGCGPVAFFHAAFAMLMNELAVLDKSLQINLSVVLW